MSNELKAMGLKKVKSNALFFLTFISHKVLTKV